MRVYAWVIHKKKEIIIFPANKKDDVIKERDYTTEDLAEKSERILLGGEEYHVRLKIEMEKEVMQVALKGNKKAEVEWRISVLIPGEDPLGNSSTHVSLPDATVVAEKKGSLMDKLRKMTVDKILK